MNSLWRLDKLIEEQTFPLLPPLTGTKAEQGAEIIRRCEARELKLAKRAIEAERAGDEECCWMCMAARAENKRLYERVKSDLEKEKNPPT